MQNPKGIFVKPETNIAELHVLDKPTVNQKLVDVTKKVWFDRGYGVTNWREEGVDSWHVGIGNLANEDGRLVIEHKRVSKNLGLPTISKSKKRRGWSSYLESTLRTMVEEGKIRLVKPSDGISELYQLTLTPERKPSLSPDYVTIPETEYATTLHCICSTTSRDVMFLGCETCRKLVLAVIKSYYGMYWLEIEEAITKRNSIHAPAKFDQSKVPESDQEFIIQSIGLMLHLCSKSTAFVKEIDTRRLFWLVKDAQNRIHINPEYFPDHRTAIPNASRHFFEEHKRDEVEKSGKKYCWNCDSINSKTSTFCGSCGSRLIFTQS